MPKLPLLALSLVAFAGLLAAPPILAGEAPPPAPALSGAPSLCSADASPVPALGAPEPQPMIVHPCSDCSDTLCLGRNLGNTCGAGPDFKGFRCSGIIANTCPVDGRVLCTCELV
jgi:hypothetical protein